MSQTDNYDREDLTLRSDFQHGDNHLPPSGQARSDTLKGIITFIVAAIVAYGLYAFVLPFDDAAIDFLPSLK